MGSSRVSWDHKDSIGSLGAYLQYESEFYKTLFKNIVPDNNWAKLVSYAKTTKIPQCLSDIIGDFRWLQFSLNPMGDPEMPIWIKTPLVFQGIKWSFLNSGFTIESGGETARISVMSLKDIGESYYYVSKDVNKIQISNLPCDFSVCFTNPGYIPVSKNIKVVDECFLDDDSQICSDITIIGNKYSQGNGAVFNNGCHEIISSDIYIGNNTVIKKGAVFKTNTR